jgi:hypothetical protein
MLKLILFQCQELIDLNQMIRARTRNLSFPVKGKTLDLKTLPEVCRFPLSHFHRSSVASCVYLQPREATVQCYSREHRDQCNKAAIE